VSDSGISRTEAARFFRQLGELHGPHLFLSSLTSEEVFELVRSQPETPDAGPSAKDAPPEPPSQDYETLRAEALSCQACELARTRKKVVFSDGSPRARLMVVGEAPGAREDETGRAFVGPAGKFLDLLLASIGLSRRHTAYICNILKCRPPGNRNPLPDEIRQCTPFLQRQIELISPEAILAVGTFSAQFLTARDSPLGRLRGEVYSYSGVPVVVTYHPAALLRNAGWTRATWDDLQLLRQVMDGA
jgi:DNA polymerase